MDDSISQTHYPLGRPVQPSPDQPGSMLQQVQVAAVALFLGEQRGTCRRAEWQDARRIVLPHAREAQ